VIKAAPAHPEPAEGCDDTRCGSSHARTGHAPAAHHDSSPLIQKLRIKRELALVWCAARAPVPTDGGDRHRARPIGGKVTTARRRGKVNDGWQRPPWRAALRWRCSFPPTRSAPLRIHRGARWRPAPAPMPPPRRSRTAPRSPAPTTLGARRPGGPGQPSVSRNRRGRGGGDRHRRRTSRSGSPAARSVSSSSAKNRDRGDIAGPRRTRGWPRPPGVRPHAGPGDRRGLWLLGSSQGCLSHVVGASISQSNLSQPASHREPSTIAKLIISGRYNV
jgi:hypothetical protein